MFKIEPLDRVADEKINWIIDQKTKPVGSLGDMENLALTLVRILTGNASGAKDDTKKLRLNKPTMLIFAGDHGISEENISIADSRVTQQMVYNFLNGGAAINCFCRSNNIFIEVIDAGIAHPIDDTRLTHHSLGRGTKNMLYHSAMTITQVNRGLIFGKLVVERHVKNGTNIFAFGEMGIGNTSSAAALQSVMMDLPIEKCVGKGTGIDESTLTRKTNLLAQSIKFHQQRLGKKIKDPIEIMSAFAGFEIVQLTGAILAAAENKCVILVDGFIATVSAILATRLNQHCRDYMVFCHQSDEKGHRLMLEYLSAKPLLKLGLRLGEGTGAALALPLIKAALSFYNDMASFESAGVTAVS